MYFVILLQVEFMSKSQSLSDSVYKVVRYNSSSPLLLKCTHEKENSFA